MRKILLTLADDTTDEFCGSCTWYEDARCHQWNLVAYNERRVPDCLAAERAAVAITERPKYPKLSTYDLRRFAEVADRAPTSDDSEDLHSWCMAALRAHAKGEP
jgi:hypothetical protein